MPMNESAVFYHRGLKPQPLEANIQLKDLIQWMPWTWMPMDKENIMEINEEPQEEAENLELPFCQSRFQFFYGNCKPRRNYS